VNLISSIVLTLAILCLLLVVNGTFNHRYPQPFAQESLQSSINVTDIDNLKGNIISIQNNASNSPEWIVSGKWKIAEIPTNGTSSNTTPQNLKFNASITMASIDGTKSHRHRLTDFKLSNLTIYNKNAIIDGTISLVTLGKENGILDNNITGIPITIKIMNLATIITDIDNKITKDHFGASSIYGKVD
jgi:hypothetical protein